MKDRKEPSIEDLCKPLSATVMPRSAQHTYAGHEMTASLALAAQRRQQGAYVKRKKKQDKN